MSSSTTASPFDAQFREAVLAVDAGDVAALEHMLAAEPRLASDRLETPGPWLADVVGNALQGFFRGPYLLWFVTEDPVRNGKLPPNIAAVAATIIAAAERESVPSLQFQLDHALRLVCWSWIARDCGVQITLIDTLLSAGANLEGRDTFDSRFGSNVEAAIYNRNYAAAEHLLNRGAASTLTTAICLGHWSDAERLFPSAANTERQDAFVQAALNGNAEALRRMLALGVAPTTSSARNQSHGTALHHAVWSGSLEAVKVLVEAGADLSVRDTIYDGTPLGWAMHAVQNESSTSGKQYQQIVEYLRSRDR